ncbi:MAG: PadR family transcriptional regulator [Kiritimatiellales bacterium]
MKTDSGREQLKGWLELLVLAALQKEPTCGYRLRQALIDRSDHVFAPAFGRLYPMLAQLEQAGLLKSRKEASGQRELKVYLITARGEERLIQLTVKWKHFARAMSRIAGT